MGTSKSNSGLQPRTPLLPPWADDSMPQDSDQDDNGEDQGEDQGEGSEETTRTLTDSINLIGTWTGAKKSLNGLISATSESGRKAAIGKSAKSYVKGSGGSRRIGQSARHGKSVGLGFGNLISSISTSGFESTYNDLGIGDFEGQSARVVFSKIADHLCSNGGTVEETIANIAVVESLSKLFTDFDLKNKDLTELNSMSHEQVFDFVELYVSTYIYERWLYELGIQIENKDVSASKIIKLEHEVKEWVQSTVNLKLEEVDSTQFNFTEGKGKQFMDEIFSNAYKMIEL